MTCMDELKHYGVLGMKWGVRKEYVPHPRKRNRTVYPNDKTLRAAKVKTQIEQDMSAPTESDEERRERLKKIAMDVALAAGIGTAVYFSYKYDAINKISEAAKNLNGNELKDAAKKAMRDASDDADIIFGKGSTFHRQVAKAGIDFSKVTDATYVSVNDYDRLRYMRDLKDWSGTGERYDVTLKAIKEVRAPSRQKAEKIFNELVKEDPSYLKQLEDTIVDAYLSIAEKQYGQVSDITMRLYRDAAKREVKEDPFGKGVYAIVRRKEDSKKFIDKLKAAGYNALEDYFDKGTFTTQPLILFDPSSTVVKTGEQFVDKALMAEVQKSASAEGWKKLKRDVIDFFTK